MRSSSLDALLEVLLEALLEAQLGVLGVSVFAASGDQGTGKQVHNC